MTATVGKKLRNELQYSQLSAMIVSPLPGDLGVVVVDGGGADDEIAFAEIVRRVADGHGNAERTQMLHRRAVRHVAALHTEAHARKHLGKRTHGNAADADKMRAFAGNEIREDVLLSVHSKIPFRVPQHRIFLRFTFFSFAIIIYP